MPNFKSSQCQPQTGYRPAISATHAGEVKAVRGSVSLPNTLAQNDIVELVQLPPQHVIVDAVLDSDDLDGGAALVMDVAIINSGGTDVVANTKVISDTTVGQTGGVARMDEQGAPRLAPSNSARNVGVKITTAAAAAQAGTLGLTLFYRAADFGG